ncbi:flagella biosynthesis regulator Flk, partial [Salmonella enterica subsp. houtenae]|nr:flagella biosynthesis regulator Flk [Salmonella enterica subsp. houtenae]
LIPAKQFTHLVTWLQARQTLSLQHAPTLHTLQAALKQPLEPDELTAIKEYAQHTYQIQPQTALTTAQVQDLLNHIFLRRVEREAGDLEPLSIQPIYRPFAPMIETVKNLSTRPGLLFIALIIVLALFWLVS